MYSRFKIEPNFNEPTWKVNLHALFKAYQKEAEINNKAITIYMQLVVNAYEYRVWGYLYSTYLLVAYAASSFREPSYIVYRGIRQVQHIKVFCHSMFIRHCKIQSVRCRKTAQVYCREQITQI